MEMEYQGEVLNIGTRVGAPTFRGVVDAYVIEVQVNRDTQTNLALGSQGHRSAVMGQTTCRVAVVFQWPPPSNYVPEWYYFEQLDFERKQKRLV